MQSTGMDLHRVFVLFGVALLATLSVSAVAYGRSTAAGSRQAVTAATTGPLAYQVARSRGVTLPPRSGPQPVLRISLKPGNYLITAKAWAENDAMAGDSEASCFLGSGADAEMTPDRTISTVPAHASETVYITSAIGFIVPRTILFQCSNAMGEPAALKYMKLIALKVASVH